MEKGRSIFLALYRLAAHSLLELDDINRKILQELETDGRLSNVALAEKVGLSPSACLRRVQDLERRGIIEGYRAVINRSALGGGLTIYVTVGLDRHTKADQTIFERAMQAAPQVRECHNITGTVEYLLRVEVADLESYKYFHTEMLGTVSVVKTLVSYIVMGSPKDLRA